MALDIKLEERAPVDVPPGVISTLLGKVQDIATGASSGTGAAGACKGGAICQGAAATGGAVNGGAVAGGAVFGHSGEAERGESGTFAGNLGGAFGGSGIPGGNAGAGGRPFTVTDGA